MDSKSILPQPIKITAPDGGPIVLDIGGQLFEARQREIAVTQGNGSIEGRMEFIAIPITSD